MAVSADASDLAHIAGMFRSLGVDRNEDDHDRMKIRVTAAPRLHAADRHDHYEHFCMNADWPYVRVPGSVVSCR